MNDGTGEQVKLLEECCGGLLVRREGGGGGEVGREANGLALTSTSKYFN